MKESLSLLDRQLAYLAGLSDTDFLFAIADFLSALGADPEIASHLAELCREADALGREHYEREYDGGAPGKLLEHIWEDLGAGLPAPQNQELIRRDQKFRQIVGHFEHPAVLPLDPNLGNEDFSRIGSLLKMVSELDVSVGNQIIEKVRHPYSELQTSQARLHRAFLIRSRSDPGVALLRLRCLASMGRTDGERGPGSSCPPAGEQPHLLISVERSWEDLLDQLVDGRRELSDFSAAPAFVAAMRNAAQRLGLELRGRIGTTRSRIALIERYKARCEWHDRDRLRALAAEASGQRENALRDDLALYLFDQGLNPISEARLGERSRADIFDPDPRSSFYLEAKQYDKGTSPIAALRAAFTQALDTAAALAGSGHEAEEAFIVVFRLGGSRLALPREPIPFDGLKWHLRLINIAPPEEDASKNREAPRHVSPEELLELLVESRDARSKGSPLSEA